jgi:hypothetical protein
MSFDFVAQKRRRIEQFEQSLAPMHHRTVQLVKDCCFAIIDERHEDFRTTPALNLEILRIT